MVAPIYEVKQVTHTQSMTRLPPIAQGTQSLFSLLDWTQLHFAIQLISPLLSLQDSHANNPITQRIHVILETFQSILSSVTLIWIPSHIGYPQHEMVDRAAKNATHLPESFTITNVFYR